MTRLLIDTHALIWFALGDPQLSAAARRAISTADETLVSVASVWEMAIKAGKGRLDLGDTTENFVRAVLGAGIRIFPIQLRHALAVEKLPRHHGDPFDRLLIAQAICEEIPIVTVDDAFPAYDVTVVW